MGTYDSSSIVSVFRMKSNDGGICWISFATKVDFAMGISYLAKFKGKCNKHNIVSLMNPLTIRVEVKGNQLTIINNIQAFPTEEASSKTGLHNLNERMKILTGQPIAIDKNQHYFKVQLTLFKS